LAYRVKTLARLALASLLASCSSPSPNAPPPRAAPAPATLPRTGVVVPLYVYPGSVWDAAIAAKRRYPAVPMAIVANVNNGPGKKRNAVYVRYVEKAQRAGIDVLGYVYTRYGKRPLATVEADMSHWYNLYHTDGIFMDEMAPGNTAYDGAATAYAHAHALWFVMGNPGTNAPGNAGPDVINFYESAGYPSPSFLRRPAHLSYGKSRWSYIAGAVPFDAARIRASAKYVGYLYATDSPEPECYCRLPSYFTRLIALLAH
jgi:hypothetical protein